jgi:TP901 family phage tail tape measure protein
MMSSEIASLYASIGADTNPLERALGKAHGLLAGMGSSMGGAISTAVGIGIAQLAGGAIKLAGGAITGAIGQASTFEQTLAMLGAVTGATSGQLGRLSDTAIQLGADTTLPGTSAVQAAQGMMELAKAGLSVDASIAAARGTIQLARAANISEAEAATIAANALNAYGLQGNQAGMVSDLLAASANASSGSIQDMAFALRMSSAVASNAGVSIQDTVTAISLLANAGLQGSDAGTSLKTMLISLQSPSKEAAGTLKDLGIRVYDNKGQMNSLQSILGQLQGATGKLTQEQKAHALQTIFGTDAIRAANILLKAGTAGFTEMSAAVNKSGAAADLASAQNAGMAGAVDALKSTVETLGLTFAKPLLEPLTRALRQFTDWIGGADAQASITQFGTLVGNTLAEVVDWVITNWPMIRQTVGDVFAAVRSVWDTVLAPAIAGIVGAFQAAVLWVQFNWPRIQGQIQSGASEVERIYNAVLKPAVDFAVGLFRKVVDWITENWPLIQQTVQTVVAEVQRIWKTYIEPLLPVVKKVFDDIKNAIQLAVDAVLGIIKGIMKIINGDWEGAWEDIKKAANDAWEAVKKLFAGAKLALDLTRWTKTNFTPRSLTTCPRTVAKKSLLNFETASSQGRFFIYRVIPSRAIYHRHSNMLNASLL